MVRASSKLVRIAAAVYCGGPRVVVRRAFWLEPCYSNPATVRDFALETKSLENQYWILDEFVLADIMRGLAFRPAAHPHPTSYILAV